MGNPFFIIGVIGELLGLYAVSILGIYFVRLQLPIFLQAKMQSDAFLNTAENAKSWVFSVNQTFQP